MITEVDRLAMPSALLQARQITKAFPGVLALDDVSLTICPGEVLCVVGENGAGKSTLMKILGGVYRPDQGEVLFEGRAVRIDSVHEAGRLGITLIHQELNLAESLTIAGNLFLGREPSWGGPLKIIDRGIHQETEKITRRLGMDCSPRTLVGKLSVGQQQLVEIARALNMKSRVLIMDEPTSSLTERETERLFEVICGLKQVGVAIVYISHRLKEVREIADRVSVLRDGRNAGELEREEISHDAVVRLMVGRELTEFFRRTRQGEQEDETAGKRNSSEPALKVAGLRVSESQREPIDFELRGGEVVGVSGLMGAGRTRLAAALFGVPRIIQGELFVDGRRVHLRGPADAIRAGIFLVPEDRRLQGLLLRDTVVRNISLGSLDRLNFLRLIALKRERELAESMCRQLNVRTPGVGQTAGLLSGGNQQKVVLAKWLCRQPRVLILDEPTRGIDVGAKAEIYGLMDELAGQGVAVLMISSDLEEILGVSDRVLVMHQGQLAGELPREELSEEAVMHLATGGGQET